MVSLRRDTDRGDSLFLGDSSVNAETDTRLVETDTHPIVGTEALENFKPLNTIYVVIFQLVAAVSFVITGIVMAETWPQDREKCEPYFILLYIHAVFWCISFIIHHHLQLQHEMLRLSGYLDFHKLTQVHVKLPFHLVSLWNAVVLVVGTIFHQAYDHFEEKCKETGFFTPVNILIIIIAVEVIALTPFLTSYIGKVWRFNKSKPSPDVLQDSFHNDSFDGGANDFSDHNIQGLLEKQADMIQYLRDHNVRLSRKIVDLTSQLRGETSASI